ncbi:hypothetical protein CDAR_555531 [Caerostris darwini]|uniref:Uncharacterized protein n=1 Tax=Caerostris darwini TaxID=1538125 RepID=A0AAV4QVH0_9ARAC|nr:hypothetical protein CDAR_555531 [Caerostris darwini]
MYRSSVCNGLGYNQWGGPLLYLWGRFTLSQSIKRENCWGGLVGRSSAVKQMIKSPDVSLSYYLAEAERIDAFRLRYIAPVFVMV